MGLVDASGNSVASYTYDPYGKVLTATGTLAEKNPLRYRGYYYDSESGLYYLQSRYYDPAVRRFINADRYASTGQGIVGYNAFEYGLNNPVCNTDSCGCISRSITMDILSGNYIQPVVSKARDQKSGFKRAIEPVLFQGFVWAWVIRELWMCGNRNLQCASTQTASDVIE